VHLQLNSCNLATILIALGVATTTAPAKADTVTFQTEHFACDLTLDNVAKGHLEPGKPLVINVPRRVEYLVQCESHEIPVKLYARSYLFSVSGMPNGPLKPSINLLPVAVLPTLVRASSSPGMEVTTTTTVRSVGCKISHGASFGLKEGRLIRQAKIRTIASGTRVRLTKAEPIHCGDTNLIEIQGSNWRAWFPNKAFNFSFRGRKIEVFPPSQDSTCCWIG